mmetsp:Transcript_57264/g.124454  ORF Transcript_57264/g.124454 Transcript_57264/m.124454 type:complete len:210 (-) Transcript_57264:662-1291(-)
MKAEQRAESTPLEPPNNELTKLRVCGVASRVASNIGSPVGDARQGDIESSPKLLVEVRKRRSCVSRPHRGSVTLPPSPRRTAESHNRITCFGVWVDSGSDEPGIEIAHSDVVACSTAIGETGRRNLATRLVAIEPQGSNTIVLIGVCHGLPHVLSRFLLKNVVEVDGLSWHTPKPDRCRSSGLVIQRQKTTRLGCGIPMGGVGDLVKVR